MFENNLNIFNLIKQDVQQELYYAFLLCIRIDMHMKNDVSMVIVKPSIYEFIDNLLINIISRQYSGLEV